MTARVSYALRFGVSLVILGALLWVVDAARLMERLRGMDLRWLAVAVVCLSLSTILMALRWQITSRRLGNPFGLGWAVREYYLAQLANLFLPGGVLGDAGRALRSPRGEAGLEGAAHAVVIERLVGQLAILALGLVGLTIAVVRGKTEWSGAGATVLLAGSAVLATALVLGAFFRRVKVVRRFFRSFSVAFLARPVILWQIGLSLVTALLLIAAFVACARATGTTMGPEGALTIVPLILTAMVIPVSLGGWGLREGAAAALFPLIGATAGAGVAAGAAYGIAMIIATLPGLACLPAVHRRSGRA